MSVKLSAKSIILVWLTFATFGHGGVRAQIIEIVDGVNADSLTITVERLVAFETRFMGSDSNWAAVA